MSYEKLKSHYFKVNGIFIQKKELNEKMILLYKSPFLENYFYKEYTGIVKYIRG